MYDNKCACQTWVYESIRKEESEYRVVALLLLLEAYFSFFILWKMCDYEYIQSKRCWKKRGSAPPPNLSYFSEGGIFGLEDRMDSATADFRNTVGYFLYSQPFLAIFCFKEVIFVYKKFIALHYSTILSYHFITTTRNRSRDKTAIEGNGIK